MSKASSALSQDKFFVEKATFGGVTLLTLHGTLSDDFDGRKLASLIRTKKVVMSTREVRRFASWGMAEWMNFMRETAQLDLYLVEGSTYSVSQLNLITGLLGHAKLTSFYASYRCAGCHKELEGLFLIPRDRAIIRDIPNSHQVCSFCGGSAPLEEYPASFFETVASRPAFDIDDEVLEFLRSHFKYNLSPDLTQFRASRRVNKDAAYMRMSGNIATLPPDTIANACVATTVLDVQAVVFDVDQLTNWRTFLQTAMTKVQSLELLGCPPGFLETAVRPSDLHDKLKIRTFTLALQCATCHSTTTQLVDVAANLEDLVQGVVPATRCPSCSSMLTAEPTPDQLALLRAFPARVVDVPLDTFINRSARDPASKLENCLTLAPPKPEQVEEKSTTRTVYVAFALAALLVLGLAVVAVALWRQPPSGGTSVVTTAPVVAPTSKPAFTRPEWIMSDVPSSAYCQDMINRVMCIGVSAYRANRNEAVTEASEAALDELVNLVGLKITEPTFRELIMPGYSNARAKALAALQGADLDKNNDAKTNPATDEVRKVRKRVVDILQASGGAAVPAQRSDWYWEEYAGEHGKSNEYLVFVRYDVPLEALRALAERYSTSVQIMGSTAVTAFPAIAWQRAAFAGGALLMKVGSPLSGAGLEPMEIVAAVGNQRISDAPSLVRRLSDSPSGELKLAVEIGDAPEKVISIRK